MTTMIGYLRVSTAEQAKMGSVSRHNVRPSRLRLTGAAGTSAGSQPLASKAGTSLRAAGKSLAKIAAALDADGVPTPSGGRRWYPSTIQRIIAAENLNKNAA